MMLFLILILVARIIIIILLIYEFKLLLSDDHIVLSVVRILINIFWANKGNVSHGLSDLLLPNLLLSFALSVHDLLIAVVTTTRGHSVWQNTLSTNLCSIYRRIIITDLRSLREIFGCLTHSHLVLKLLLLLILHNPLLRRWITRLLRRLNAAGGLILYLLIVLEMSFTPFDGGVLATNSCCLTNWTDLSHLNNWCLNLRLGVLTVGVVVSLIGAEVLIRALVDVVRAVVCRGVFFLTMLGVDDRLAANCWIFALLRVIVKRRAYLRSAHSLWHLRSTHSH